MAVLAIRWLLRWSPRTARAAPWRRAFTPQWKSKKAAGLHSKLGCFFSPLFFFFFFFFRCPEEVREPWDAFSVSRGDFPWLMRDEITAPRGSGRQSRRLLERHWPSFLHWLTQSASLSTLSLSLFLSPTLCFLDPPPGPFQCSYTRQEAFVSTRFGRCPCKKLALNLRRRLAFDVARSFKQASSGYSGRIFSQL